jgi:hypothetical protein
MNKKLLVKLLTTGVVMIAGMYGFFQFMTHGRDYLWSKEYKELLQEIISRVGMEPTQTTRIEVRTIQRSTRKKIQIVIQSLLSKVDLMPYASEYGESTLFKSQDSEGYLNCKGWCSGDYLIGMEIEYYKIEAPTLQELKAALDKPFYNYRIVWTPIDDE